LAFLKLLVYGAILSLVLYVAIKGRERLLAVLRDLWRALRDLWTNLFRSRRSISSEPSPQAARPVRANHPFARFSNPFASDLAATMPLPDLIVYTFNGLEAWSEERQCGRSSEETPLEFCARLGEQIPDLEPEAGEVARLYAQVAYAATSSLPDCESLLNSLWDKLTSLNLTSPSESGRPPTA
jgi:hypothetical protein